MHGKTVLITGATQGIGKQSAIALGAMGAKLVLVCRNEQKARASIEDIEREGKCKGVELIVADLSSMAEVRRAAQEFLAKHDRLDVLLNNAGVLVTSRKTTVDGLETTFATNHLAYFLMTELLLPALKKTDHARIVNVASHAHKRAKAIRFDDLQFEKNYSTFDAYSHSKLCNIAFTYELARRLQGSGVTANCLHPGVVATGFGQTYGGAMSWLIKIAHVFMIDPKKGAETSVYLASSKDVEGVTGKYYDKCKAVPSTKVSYDQAAAKRLWEVSEALVSQHTKATAA